jgi:diaminopimelate decarboxylase
MRSSPQVQSWGLETGPAGELRLCGHDLTALADTFGTPLHVIHCQWLQASAAGFLMAFRAAYPGKVSIHYAFKCNSLPVVIGLLRRCGLGAEIMSGLELELALRLGYRGHEIVVNGPAKSDSFLQRCVHEQVRLIVVDSLEELTALNGICRRMGDPADILLRINPDYVPRGMNSGSATASRRGCAFGLDLKGGEVGRGLDMLREMPLLHCRGFHLHIGTGIRDARDYRDALDCLPRLKDLAASAGCRMDILDLGGGFAAAASREMTSCELLLYQALGVLPASRRGRAADGFADFAAAIGGTVSRFFSGTALPELLLEPGRCLVSSSQLLLLKVIRVKERPGIRKWLITDGGLGTVTLPTFYEHHELLLANDATRPPREKVTITGPVCFAGDIVYRNKLMPVVRSGEVLALMDSGAYFLAWESSFGFPRPAVVAVDGESVTRVRRAESLDDMVARDDWNGMEAKK